MPKPTRLRALKVHEVSLVDRPANPHARVLFAKRAEPDEVLLGKLEEELAKNTDAPTALARVAALLGFSKRKPAQPGDATMKCPKCGKEMVEKSCPDNHGVIKADGSFQPAEEVIKSLPAEARVVLEKAQSDAAAAQATAAAAVEKMASLTTSVEKLTGQLTGMIEKSASDETVALAKRCVGVTTAKVDEVAAVLKQLDATGRATVEAVFAQYNAVLKSSGLFKEFGSATGEKTDAQTELRKAMDTLKAADPKLTDQQAMKKAFDADPKLYDRLQ